MTAALVRMLGVRRLALVEDLVQETLLAALQAWPGELPRDPEAWLFTVMRNRARDALRRERTRGEVLDDERAPGDADVETAAPPDETADTLRMMFSCCHPALTDDGRTALILRLVCGFGTAEVACAFLCDQPAMEKRLVRAKRALINEGQIFEPSRERLPAVLTALYLMFDAGYHGSVVDEPIRAQLCAEAIRLTTALASSTATATPEVDALLALMYLHAARMPARIDSSGELIALEHQDRSRWDAELIARGMNLLGASARGDEASTYHLEAGIAAVHAMAPSVEATPWNEIVALYDQLFALKPTPVVALARSIASAQLEGPSRGVETLLSMTGREQLGEYPFYWAALGDLSLRAGDRTRALTWFQRGRDAARNDAERAMFGRRILECVEYAPRQGRNTAWLSRSCCWCSPALHRPDSPTGPAARTGNHASCASPIRRASTS